MDIIKIMSSILKMIYEKNLKKLEGAALLIQSDISTRAIVIRPPN